LFCTYSRFCFGRGSIAGFVFPSWESAFYFSAASYATVGYGDLVLPQVWRTLGPVESVIGVLMCGLSASFLFAIVTRLVEREVRLSDELARPVTDLASTPQYSWPSAYSQKENRSECAART